jgi:hypothetical protein
MPTHRKGRPPNIAMTIVTTSFRLLSRDTRTFILQRLNSFQSVLSKLPVSPWKPLPFLG